MPIVQPGLFHRLAVVVDDLDKVDAWYRRVFGCAPLTVRRSGRGAGVEAEGDSTQLLWHGGLPLILLGTSNPNAAVGRFLARWGPSLHSLAWEIDDMWTVEHRLRERDIHVTGVNIPGRHFFTHPADTHGVLVEWTDTTMPGDHRRGAPLPAETGGVVGEVLGIAWVTAVVADADATASFLGEVASASAVPETVNPRADEAVERTVDVQVGDLTVQLVTPQSESSRYWPVLEKGPRLWSYALRVADLDTAIEGLAREGVRVENHGSHLAWTDPATSCGIPIELTDAAAR